MENHKDVFTPTPFEDIVVPSEVIELPAAKTSNGTPVYVRVQMVGVDEMAVAVRGLPVSEPSDNGAAVAETFEQSIARLAEFQEPAQKIAALGVIEPRFYFGEPEDGKAPWRALSVTDQAAIVKAIMRISGWANEETLALRTFPAGEGGGLPGSPGGGGPDGLGTGVAREGLGPTTEPDPPAPIAWPETHTPG